MSKFDRNILLIGEEGQKRLEKAKVLVFGVGGVGGYVCEALARAGVGQIDIVDKDFIDETNINRQIIATTQTVGLSKVAVMKERMQDINPDIKCQAMEMFYLPENREEISFKGYDYVIDAVDTVSAKIAIIEEAKKEGVKVISSMGTAGKLEPGLFEIADISKTSVCPLAKVMRKELRARNIEDVKVLFSKEETIKNPEKGTPGSISFVPSVAGLMIGGYVIREIVQEV